MCVLSMVSDYQKDKWFPQLPQNKYPTPPDYTDFLSERATKKDMDSLRKEVEEMKELLKRALKYDEVNNEPHCEVEEKIEVLRKVAEFVGVTLEDILGKEQSIENVCKQDIDVMDRKTSQK